MIPLLLLCVAAQGWKPYYNDYGARKKRRVLKISTERAEKEALFNEADSSSALAVITPPVEKVAALLFALKRSDSAPAMSNKEE